jgi:uncharacterized Zn finger protein
VNWYRYEPTTPLRVDGGVKARTKRGRIGSQWWSRRFIDVLESAGMGGRLQRGRRYARAGQVVTLDLEPGIVTALVQGSRPEPYDVTIEVDCLSEEEWQDVEDALAERAIFRAKLLAGEMPNEIEDVFDDVGVPLFPEEFDDFDMACSCPDWGMPCKHLAAVLYLLAERFDDDPFDVLLWRGQERDDLLYRLRGHAGAGAQRSGPPPVEDVPLEECMDRFWESSVSLARLQTREPPAPSPPDLVLRIQQPPDLDDLGSSIVEVFVPAYDRLAGEPPT